MRTFNYNGHQLREFDGWISATDIAKVLNYRNASILCLNLGDDKQIIEHHGRQLLVVNRNGLRRIVSNRWDGKALLAFADYTIFKDDPSKVKLVTQYAENEYACPRCNMEVRPDFNWCPYCSQPIRFSRSKG